MAYSFPEIKRFVGLKLQANTFNVADGSLEIADNFVLNQDYTPSKRKGFYTYFDPSSGTLNQLFTYQSKLIAAYNDKIRYYNDTGSSPNYTGSEQTISGETIAITGSRVSRSVESNNNFYFTTDTGPIKLTAYNSSSTKMGAPQGLDINARFIPGQATFLVNSSDSTIDYTVGYRVLFGYRDTNANLILSAPSSVYAVSNVGLSSLVASVAGATMTITSVAHGLTTGMYLTFYAAAGFTDSANANGTYAIVVTSLDAFTYTPTSPPTVGPGTISYRMASTVRIEASIPSEINSTALGWFAQIYRSSVQLTSIGIFSDYRLEEERTLTSAEITNHVMFFSDSTPQTLLGSDLYTNENTGEGELEANFRPPLCNDLCFFKGFTFFGNCTTRHLLELSVIDPTALSSLDYIQFKITSNYRSYKAYIGVGNRTVRARVTSSAGDVLVGYTAHGFSNNDSVYIANITGTTNLTDGAIYYVVSKATDSFKVAATIAGTPILWSAETSLDVQGVTTMSTTQTGVSWVRATDVVTITNVATYNQQVGDRVYVSNAAGGTLTTGIYTILTTPTVNTFTFASVGSDDASGNTCDYNVMDRIFYLSQSTDASVRLRDVAQALVKAVNRDTNSAIYAQYSSSPSEVPGKMRFQAIGFGDPIYVLANTTAAGRFVYPNLPSSYAAGTQVYSTNQNQPNVLYIAKGDEPEAVPLLSNLPAGPRNKELLRNIALRDSVVILTQGGVYRLTGDNRSNFNIVPIDTTIICVSANSVKVLNNNVIFLSNQGVCMVTESSIQIVSREIEDVIQPILGQANIATITSAVAYETQRLYLLCTSEPSTSTATQTYCYNFLTDSWTTWSRLFTQGIVGPNDILYLINNAGNISKGRKNQTRIDYSDEFYSITVDSVAADNLSATITSLDYSPLIGDMIVKDDIISRIDANPISLNSTQYTITFARATNLVAADSVILYQKYISQLKLSPFHAGLVGRMKHFAQMQAHFRSNSCSKLEVTFSGNSFGSSAPTNWVSELLALGWGSFPWGLEPWGQGSSITLTQGTTPAGIARLWISRYQARNTFIQPLIVHQEAGESIDLQAISFDVRAYSERVSK